MNDILTELRKTAQSSLTTVGSASKQRLKRMQAERDLEKLYWKLGKEVVALVNAGEIDHPALIKRRDRIVQQLDRIAENDR